MKLVEINGYGFLNPTLRGVGWAIVCNEDDGIVLWVKATDRIPTTKRIGSLLKGTGILKQIRIDAETIDIGRAILCVRGKQQLVEAYSMSIGFRKSGIQVSENVEIDHKGKVFLS